VPSVGGLNRGFTLRGPGHIATRSSLRPARRRSPTMAGAAQVLERPAVQLGGPPPPPPGPRGYGGGGGGDKSSLQKLDVDQTSRLLGEWVGSSRLYRMTDDAALAEAHTSGLATLQRIGEFNEARASLAREGLTFVGMLTKSTVQTYCMALIEDAPPDIAVDEAIRTNKIVAIATVALVPQRHGAFEDPGIAVSSIAVNPAELNYSSSANLMMRFALRALAARLELPISIRDTGESGEPAGA